MFSFGTRENIIFDLQNILKNNRRIYALYSLMVVPNDVTYPDFSSQTESETNYSV